MSLSHGEITHVRQRALMEVACRVLESNARRLRGRSIRGAGERVQYGNASRLSAPS